MQDGVPLDAIIDRLAKITADRTRRAVAAMSPTARHFFSVIPVLLHYNHPILPGFVPGNTPHGICNFSMSPSQMDYLDTMCSVGNCNIISYIENPAIVSLYCMGSTSSVGQSASSDLDIWVCYSHLMPGEDVKKLEQKCGVVANVAQNQGVDVNFFLIPDNKFRRRDSTTGVDGENCGSALHLLLLEEFYRSSLWMAGKKLAWYLVPEEYDTSQESYNNYVNSLFLCGKIRSSEWFDLGSINDIPVKEFFGSAMWLLYKAVDSPYKAVLKIMLMEAYAYEYPDVRFVACQIRERMQHSDSYDLSMDSYHTAYERIIEYLNCIGDLERPEVVKACFLMKIAAGIDEKEPSAYMQWRINLVHDFVERCSMDQKTAAHLRSNSNWKIDDVSEAYRLVTRIMLQCSNRLRTFSNRAHKMGSPIDVTDFQILTQKLSTAFEPKRDKIIRVNLNIAPNLEERHISLVYVAPGGINRSGWYLYPTTLAPLDLVRRRCVYFHRNPVNVICWAIGNGVLTPDTEISISGGAPAGEASCLRALAEDLLKNRSSLWGKEVSNRDLVGPMYFKHLILLLNVSADVTLETDRKELDLSNIDVLSVGEEKKSLLSSIDVAFRNSWGEIYVKRYQGEKEIIQGITEMLNIRRPGTSVSRIPRFTVLCYSRFLSGIIRQHVEDLLKDLLLVAHSTGERNSSMVFMMGSTSYSVIRNHKNVTITPLRDSLDLMQSIHAMEIEMARENGSSPFLEQIYQYASKGVVQFFFEQSPEGCIVYVLDENNQMKSYMNSGQDCGELVGSISRTFTEQLPGAGRLNSTHFAVPQFYMLTRSSGELKVDCYRAGDK